MRVKMEFETILSLERVIEELLKVKIRGEMTNYELIKKLIKIETIE